MRSRLSAGAALLALLALGGCSTLSVSTDYDRAVDFNRYQTYDFLPVAEGVNPLIFQRVLGAVQAQLDQRGLRKDTESPDLLVALHGRVDTEIQVDVTSYNYGYSSWGYWGYYGTTGVSSASVREVPIGTLIIDVVDTEKNELVWQSVASDTMDPLASPDKRDRRIWDAVNKMFSQFPRAVVKK